LHEREAEPGTRWDYVSVDTHVLGMIIAGATGRDPADLMAERIIQPMGFEAEPYFLTDGEGTAFVLGGLNMRTRDYARFGQMVLQKGEWQGKRIVSADWVEASTLPSAPNGALYGYQWWIPKNAMGDFMAQGIYGQFIYFSPRHDTVIVVNAVDRHFKNDGVDAVNEAMLKTIAAVR
ncbi:MAG: serine hydrolase, partial [Albidovulum sp.]|uniref:serine hydrolase domain-containing protein n=1 Tax=Albidovulum sp. TaxID=1872424 RepID=UPI003CAC0F6E